MASFLGIVLATAPAVSWALVSPRGIANHSLHLT